MMPEISLLGVLIVAAIAFVVPLTLGLVPALRVPSVVIEIVAGIIIGPAVLGLVEVDEPLQFMALVGLAFLLFLAGMEIDLGGLLRGGALRSAGLGFALSLVITFGISSLLGVAGLIQAPLFVAIMLSATSLGIVVPVLADAGQSRSTLGQLIISASSIADFGAVILLSLFFSGDSSSIGSTLLLIGAFVALVAAIGITVAEIEHLGRLSMVLRNLQDSSAQIRVRGAFLFLIGFAVLAQLLGLESILGAFYRRHGLAAGGQGRDDDASPLPTETRGGRLRRLYTFLLRHQRYTARRGSTSRRWRGGTRSGTDLPLCSAARPRTAGDPV